MLSANPACEKAVLIVDDDPDIREVMVEVVESTRRRVITAADGSEALKRLDSVSRPCLVLLDLQMEPMSGPEFLLRLQARSDAAEFPVVLMPASPPVTPSARNAPGVVAVLRKPFSVGDLSAILNEHGPHRPESSPGAVEPVGRIR